MIKDLLKRVFSGFNIYEGWLMVAVGFMMMLLMFGTRLSFGIYIKPMTESFGASRAAISGSQSLYMFVYAFFALLAGSLSDRYGPRKILMVGAVFMGVGMLLASRITAVWQYYLSYGVLVAVGSGAMYVPVTGTVSKFFTRRRNFAIGITVSGAGLGQFLIPPFMERVVESQGWPTAFFYTAMLLMVFGISLPLLLLKGRGLPEDIRPGTRGDPAPKGDEYLPESPVSIESNRPQKHYTLKQAMTTVPFWMFFSMYFIICFIVDGIIWVHLCPYLTDIGFSGQTAAKALGYLGLIATVTMVVFAPVGDRVNKRGLLTGLLAANTLLLFWLIHLKGAFGLWLLIILFGIIQGAAWPMTVSILSDIFGSGSVSSILGASTIAVGLAGLISPWLAGYTFDIYKSYVPVFYLTIILSLLSVVFTYYTRKTKGML